MIRAPWFVSLAVLAGSVETDAQGTLVKDIQEPYGAAEAHSHPGRFIALRERVIFAATHQDYGQELWISDGTEVGTTLLKDIHPTGSSNPRHLTLFQDRVLFLVVNETATQLWSTNGSELGTQHVADIGGADESTVGPMIATDDYAIFFVDGPRGNNAIWRTDGTTVGTYPIAPLGFLDQPPDLGVYKNEVYFTQWGIEGPGDTALWKTDGTGPGTFHVDPLSDSQPTYPRKFTVAGDYLYFTAINADGRELWRTDGTGPGTTQLADILPGSGGSEPKDLVALDNGLLLCSATSAFVYDEIWRSDGTSEGTLALYSPPPTSSHANSLVSFGDEAWFHVPWYFEDDELWRTDGTADGTFEIVKHEAFTGDFQRVGSDKRIVWTGIESGPGGAGREPWISDGTLAGTRMISDVRPGEEDSQSYGYTRAGDNVFFSANDGVVWTELHAFDLTDFGGWVAERFGTGCGAIGTPELALSGALVSGGAVTFKLADATPFAPSALYFSPTSAQDVIGECSSYLAQPQLLLSTVTDAAGAAELPATVPIDPAIVGVFVVTQSVSIAAGGPLFGIAELSNGIELIVGS